MVELADIMYEGKKVYGPYTRKDGRQIVILKTPGKYDRQTVSYPKYLVECFLGRYLEETETVDHIDGNFLNNDLSNLRVVDRSSHCRSHTKERLRTVHICPVCGKSYEQHVDIRKTCGSKHCAGYYVHLPKSIRVEHEAELQIHKYKSLRYILDTHVGVVE